MKHIFSREIIAVFLVGIFMVAFFSCKKKKSEFPVSVNVFYKGSTSQAVGDAYVKLYKNNVEVELTTDASGHCEYTFNLPMILQVYAKKDTCTGPDSTHRPVAATTIVRLLENEKVEKTVYLQ